MHAAILACSNFQGNNFEASLVNINTQSVLHWSYQLRSSASNVLDIDWNSSVSETECNGDIDPSQMRSILSQAVNKYKFLFSRGEVLCKLLQKILVN